ncbi:MAG: Rossman fold protein family [Daejeonella sp.]|nr:Rossman fold protein family [Daejeonella sp.]
MDRITVFCGSSLGNEKIYQDEAFQLGILMAKKNLELVYGGAKVGLMGAVADGVLTNNGTVIGVLPNFLSSKEVVHENLTQLIMVDSMHERKTKMNELCDGVIALPGGFGTLEELFEMLTWGQLGLHKKPIGLLNIKGYYDLLIQFVENMVDKGLLKKINQEMIIVSSNAEELLTKMENYIAPEVTKWIKQGRE